MKNVCGASGGSKLKNYLSFKITLFMISVYEDSIQIELSQNVFLKGYEISLSSYFEALSRNIQGSLEHVFVLAYMYMKYDMSEYVYKSITNYEV